MSEAAAAAESGPLSVDQAVAAMSAPDQEAPEAAVDDTPEAEEPEADESEAPSEAEETPEPEEAIEGEEEREPESEPEAPAIAAPHSWTAEERARFATLPRETQEFLAQREGQREQAVAKAQQEAADARKSAEVVSQWKAQADTVLAQAQQTFAGKWDNVDWVAWASQDPEAATVGRFEYEAEQQQLQQLTAAQQQAENIAFQSHWSEVAAELPKVAADLVDPKEGSARLNKVQQFLLDAKVATAEDLRWATASQLALAYDAMRWREAQAKPAPRPAAPKPAAAPVARTVRPSAPPPQQSSQAKVASAHYARLSKTGSIEDAVAFLNAKGSR